MKKYYLTAVVYLLSFFLTSSIYSQSAGDIAFVGFNADGNDEFAFITLVDIPANTSIWFTDNEWDGTDRFNNINEGELEWSHTAVLPAGSMVVIAGNVGGTSSIVSGLGTISGNGLNLGASNETLYALLSEPISSAAMPTPNFLAGISNDLSGDSVGLLTNTGLTAGVNFIDFDNDLDGFKFTGKTFGQTSLSDYLPIIMNTGNWQMEISDGNLVLDGGTFEIGELSIINLTWNGSANDNDWTNTSNWTPTNMPVSTSDILIPSGLSSYPTISSATTVKGITIASGASLIANASVAADVTYNRNIPDTNWHLVSAPVFGETFQDIIANNTFATGTGTNIGIGIHVNSGDAPWFYATNPFPETDDTIIPSGIGTSMKLENPGNITISGVLLPAATNHVYPISLGDRNSFNLLGNPYTSYINSATLTAANTVFLTEETVWLWNGTQYETYNAVNPIEIAPGQAFFVEAAADDNFVFPTSNRSHQSTDTFLRQEPIANFELFVENGTNKNSTKVFYVEGKTTGFDNGYDSKMFDDGEQNLAVFTQLITDNEYGKLAIQTLPDTFNATIPVGLIAKANEEITFSIESLNLPEGAELFLEDRKNNEFINLSQGAYTTTLTEDANGAGQFYITTSAKSLSTNDLNLDSVSIYKSSSSEVTITGLNSKANVSIFSLLGKEVVKTTIEANGVNKINLPSLSSGVYIVSLNSEEGSTTKKITLD